MTALREGERGYQLGERHQLNSMKGAWVEKNSEPEAWGDHVNAEETRWPW